MIHVNPDVDLSDATKAELQQQAEAQDGVKKS